MAISNNSASRVWLDGARLVATEGVPWGVFLAQYTGEVVTREELGARLTSKYRPDQKLHVLPLGDEAVVDASLRGGLARLATHSCAPNTEVVTWLAEVEGQPQACLAMYSLRDIREGEQLSYNYSPQLELLKAAKPCSCGALSCRKLLGSSLLRQGPVQCSACQEVLLQVGERGEVVLHPALALPVCQPCRERLGEADWSQGACRWCGLQEQQGIHCSGCQAAFCNKCLNVNLGPGYIKLASASLDSWTCLLCVSAPLDKLRAKLVAPQAGGGVRGVQPRSPGGVRMPKPQVRQSWIARSNQSVCQTIRAVRPSTPRQARPRTPGPRPGTPALSRGVLPSPRLGQAVSIQPVAAPAPSPAPQRSEQTTRLLSQLQRYGGLSIQPVSEDAGLVDLVAREMEGAGKLLSEAAAEVRNNHVKRMIHADF